MARIFHVTLTREIQLSIVGESAEEVKAALEGQTHEFVDWSDDDDWEIAVHDPIKHEKRPSRIPATFKEPEMGILKGEGVNIHDYKAHHPDYMAKVEEDARVAAEALNITEKVPLLPGIE